MSGISKVDRLKILAVFNRRIGLLFLFVIALYFDGKDFAFIFPNAQTITNIFMLIAFFLLYKRSVKRTRELMIYAVIIGFAGEYLFSIVLDMYTYRLSNLPLYIPFGHAAVYARTYTFSKASIIKKHKKIIVKLLTIIISLFALFYLIVFNDVNKKSPSQDSEIFCCTCYHYNKYAVTSLRATKSIMAIVPYIATFIAASL